MVLEVLYKNWDAKKLITENQKRNKVVVFPRIELHNAMIIYIDKCTALMSMLCSALALFSFIRYIMTLKASTACIFHMRKRESNSYFI